tara:strand:- start:377 stop:811 length:435 start_codon:yes stop_codon:yes gene_type:complete
MNKVIIINGPNLNFLGIREIEKYGSLTYEDLKDKIIEHTEGSSKVEFFQSNSEGEIITYLQKLSKDTAVKGLIINPGGLTHSSISLRDALSILKVPIVEVHITDIGKRESYRRINLISDLCKKSILGKGIDGYIEGIDFLNEEN